MNIANLLAVLPTDTGVDLGDKATVGLKFDDLLDITVSGMLKTGLNLAFSIAGIISLFYLIWGGIQWIMSGGDKEGLEKAKKKVTAALIGLAVVFSTYALLSLISTLFQVELLNLTIGKIGS